MTSTPACNAANLLARTFLFILLLIFIQKPGFTQASWSLIATPAPDSSGSLMLLLSDGSVLCKTTNGGDRIGNMWNKLTPNSNGSYINGTWSRVCPMADSRLYFSSQTLKSGKVYLAGGEFGSGGGLGEIYDPVTNSWTQLPNTNNYLGDANSAIMEDGRILQAALSSNGKKTLIFDPPTNTYLNGPNTIGGHDESTWLKLPDKSILFVDINSTNSERYIPSLNQWIADATVSSNLYDPYGSETGPGFLLPDGRAFYMGSLGNTAFYTPSGNNTPGSWSSGPPIPGNNGMPDAAGAMMVDGKIIFCAGPKPIGTNSVFIVPTYYYEFDYLNNTYTQLSAPGGGLSTADTAFTSVMLNLPDGSIMLSRQATKNYYVHRPTGLPLAAGKPIITSVAQNACSNTFTLTGLLFNGICEGACYGDDWQMDTNFPIVRLASGTNVYYARTYNWNRTGVQTGNLADTTLFELPANIPAGTYSLSVIANGNSSNPVTFTFTAFPALTSPLYAPDICSGNNFTYAATANLNNTSVMWTRAAIAGISNPAVTIPQANNPNETLYNTAGISKTVVYSYTLTNGNCATHYMVSAVVHPTNAVSVTGNSVICQNAAAILKVTGLATYSWSTGAFTNSITVSPTVTTTYSVAGYSFNGCLSSKQLTVSVKNSPTVSITGQTVLCIGETVVLTASSTSNFYNWDSGVTTNTIAVSPVSNTSYSVTSFAANGCSGRASISVSVQTCDGIQESSSGDFSATLYPNPLAEKINIRIFTANQGTYLVRVFDVFGRLVKQSEFLLDPGVNDKSIDLASEATGLYVMTIQNNSKLHRAKLTKE